MNADYSDALGRGTNAFAQGLFAAESTSGPYKLRVAPDDSLIENDFAGNGLLYLFSPDLSSSNPGFSVTQLIGIHGDKFGTPDLLINNVQGTNYCWTLWVFDGGIAESRQRRRTLARIPLSAFSLAAELAGHYWR